MISHSKATWVKEEGDIVLIPWLCNSTRIPPASDSDPLLCSIHHGTGPRQMALPSFYSNCAMRTIMATPRSSPMVSLMD